MSEFVVTSVFKRDIFSEIRVGHFADRPETRVVRRELSGCPWWSKPVAWFLARREIAALRAATGIVGTPGLVGVDRAGLFRGWTEGTPLHLARPAEAAWYRDARRLLRELRRAGVTHNDLAKPQNWLMTPEGRAAVIDFQLASLHRRRGGLFRLMAREDLRHLLKQKRAFAPALLTPSERRLLARKSWPARLWRATGKRLYMFVTRKLMNWSDGEGTGRRIEIEGPTLTALWRRDPRVTDVAFSVYPLAARGLGLYAFVETDLDEASLRAMAGPAAPDLVQPVARLPRGADGRVRADVLRLVALNQIGELDALVAREPALAEAVRPIVDGRLQFSDRRVTRFEAER